MNIKIFLTAFLTVFLAELGDKTQLATLAMAAEPGAKIQVFLGAGLALVLTTALAVLMADILSQWVPQYIIKRASAVLFLILGVMMLKDSFSAV